MTEKEQIKDILETLDASYPKQIICYLDHKTPLQLLVATILSAQCTDDRVNIVTKSLFKKYEDVQAFAEAEISILEEDIRSTGFYKNKAKNIKACCTKLIAEYKGEVPCDIHELTELAGVGRKTANVIRGNIFYIPSVVVDTHVKRISIRWGLTLSTDPVAIETDIMNKIPEEHWIRYNTQVIAHGRTICMARSPKCQACMFLQYCPYGLQRQLENLPDFAKEALAKGHMY